MNSVASRCTMRMLLALKIRACSLSCLQTRALLSTKTAWAAPLDNASKPSAPLPANKSRHFAPTIDGDNQLNSVSRTRSGVGRSDFKFGNSMFLLRHCPAMMRTLGDTLSPDDDRYHFVRVYMFLKSCDDLFSIYLLGFVGKGAGIVECEFLYDNAPDPAGDLRVTGNA